MSGLRLQPWAAAVHIECGADGQYAGPGDAYQRNLQAFTRLHRRIEALERSFFRALQHLQRLHATGEPDDAPAPDPKPWAPDPAPGGLASFSTIPRACPPDLNKALRL